MRRFVRLPVLVSLFALLPLLPTNLAVAACPEGISVPITSGGNGPGAPVVFSFADGPIAASFFVLGDGDRHNSGGLVAADWLERLGDLDGDGRIEYRLRAPGTGAGGWGDPRAVGCPATAGVPYAPLVVILSQPREDLDRDGAFDIFEDINHNRALDFGEDRDGDSRLTPRDGCEGFTREDVDCDGHIDVLKEDLNDNGVLDPGEDVDGDGRLDAGIEDRNHDQILNDRPFPRPDDNIVEILPDGTERPLPPFYPYQSFRPAPGGIVVASAAWNGSAYDFDAINTPTRAIHAPGGAYRAVDAVLREDFFGLRVSSFRSDFVQTAARLRLEAVAPARVDDVSGSRLVFDSLHATLISVAPGSDQFFLETGSRTAVLRSRGAFLSIFGVIGGPVIVPIEGAIRSTGSDALLQGEGLLPVVLIRTLDQDLDTFPLPNDNCPGVSNGGSFVAFQADSNGDGVGDACDPTIDPDAVIAHSWSAISSAFNPGDRLGAAAAYDAARGVVVLFGGADDTATWEYDGSAWTRVVTPAAPDARTGHRMVYDDTRRRILLFGGTRLSGGALNDLWAYTAGTWSLIATPVAPPSPSPAEPQAFNPESPWFGMTYDSAHRILVLFGGGGDGRTWVFDGTTWKVVPTARSPLRRILLSMVYDPIRQVSVLHGGMDLFQFSDEPRLFNDTWEFDGTSWQPVDAPGDFPPNWSGHFEFDPVRRRAILYGGEFDSLRRSCNPTTGQCSFFRIFFPTRGTRVYDGSAWSFLPTRPTTDVGGGGQAHAYDLRRDRMMVYGTTRIQALQHAELLQPGDDDGDGIASARDVCPFVPDTDQADLDRDGFGDRCDNCPALPNPTQRDLDRDGAGDACDGDIDADGVANGDDACPAAFVDGRPPESILGGGGPDSDGDGTADDCDACPRDPANDSDRDGICGDQDNCPGTFNPVQADANGDGSGDACQPSLTLGEVRQDGGPTLEVMARAIDPDGDLLSGTIEFFEVAGVTLRSIDLSSPDACSTDVFPAGNPGTGVGYFGFSDTDGSLFDVDSVLAGEIGLVCDDGQPDYVIARGRCAQPGIFPSTILTLSAFEVPVPICIGRYGNGGFDPGTPRTDLTVTGLDLASIRLESVLTSPALVIGFSAGLPQTGSLGGLFPGATYRMVITVTDGTTVPVTAETLVLYQGEETLLIDDGQHLADIALSFTSPQGKGSGTVTWSTTAEFNVRGFNVVVVDARGNRVQQNSVLIPCEQCITGLGATYATVIPKHKSGRNLFVEMVLTDGTTRTFGPARP